MGTIPAESPHDVRRRSSYSWLLATALIAIWIGAFAVLLGSDYSPENYGVTPGSYGLPEKIWIQISCIAAVVVLIWLRRHPEECIHLVRAGRVATAASAVVLAKRVFGVPVQCWDPILFATACGWTAALWLQQGNKTLALDRTGSLTWGRYRCRVDPPIVLTCLAWSAAAGLSVYYVAQQIEYFDKLALGYADCGEYVRIMFNTIHNPRELFLRVNPEKPLFYDHFEPGILPFIPLWLLWPDIQLTMLLQVLVIVGCVVPIYWIGRICFQDTVGALLLVAAWLVYSSISQLIYSGSYGFRWGNLCLPLYFLALGCWLKGRRLGAFWLALWAILIKEEAAVLVGTFGAYVALFEKRRWLGCAIMVTAFAYFLLVSSVIIPAMGHQGYVVQSFYSKLGTTKWDIFLSPWTKPRVFWGNLLSASTFYFAALLLGPQLFVPLKSARVLFTGLPIFVFDCLYPSLKSICYWYQVALLPVAFWALVAALQPADNRRRRSILCGTVVAGLLLSVFFGNTFWSKNLLPVQLPPGRLQPVQRMARHIDPRGSLFATQKAAAILSLKSICTWNRRCHRKSITCCWT